MSVDHRRFAPATQRNRDAILSVLQRSLPKAGTVLEIASGSGEHAVFFAKRFPQLVFCPSDPSEEARDSIESWRVHSNLSNLRSPISIDVAQAQWETELPPLDAILCINMVHISPWSATEGLIRGAAQALKSGGSLYLYGPYQRDGQHTAHSNAAFDQSLRTRNPEWGVRDLEAVEALADRHGFERTTPIPMPANNLSLVFYRGPSDGPPRGGMERADIGVG